MDIALIILHADIARGGAERYTLDAGRALLERGHGVTLVASTFAGEIDTRFGRVLLQPTGRSKTGRYNKFLDLLDAHLAKQSYDVVHAMLPVRQCELYHPHAGLAVAAIEQGHEKHGGLAKPVAKLFNRFNPKRQRFAAVERELLSQSDRPMVICLSDYIRRAVRAYYPQLAESDLTTLINAVDLDRFHPTKNPEARAVKRRELGLCDDQVAALIVAQDFERKGLRETIGALSGVSDARLQLIVVGKDNPSPYEKLAKSLRVSDRVRFAGPSDDVYAHYRAADFFVLPTRHDPCSLVVLEALAMGLPVISTKQNGATEVMENGMDGFVLDNASCVDALADAMRQLCDPILRKKMSDACITRRARLSFERHMDELVRIYQRAMSRRSDSSAGTRREGQAEGL